MNEIYQNKKQIKLGHVHRIGIQNSTDFLKSTVRIGFYSEHKKNLENRFSTDTIGPED